VYARGLKLFETAEQLGFDCGWVAQHHVHAEGGLPSPLVFLGMAAARTTRLTLATGIITLPLEHALRLAEDAAVLDSLSGGRLELGFGTGGNDVVFSVFGRALDERQEDYDRAFAIVRDALAGKPLKPGGPPMYPTAERLTSTFWEAAMSVAGAVRAAEHGSGLLLARTAARSQQGAEGKRLWDAQAAFVEAFLEHWPSSTGVAPRIGLSRSVYVADTRAEALADAEPGMRRYAEMAARRGLSPNGSVEELLSRFDVHIGGPEDVIDSLRADRLLSVATDLIVQVHPVDPAPEKTLHSVQLMAQRIAPALGWQPAPEASSQISDAVSVRD
jgi:putative FMN-dependent luciferase-like monooxygenase